MTALRTVKATSGPYSVGVIASEHDFARALRLRTLPDFFEMRLDALLPAVEKIATHFSKLHSPCIITARDPKEGGFNNLPLARRRALLLRFLPFSASVDVELLGAKNFSAVLRRARARKICVILSRHDFKDTPNIGSLMQTADRAHSLGADIFKVATRTDHPEQLDRLLEFVRSRSLPLPVSVMGIGKLGRFSRSRLARAGSVLNYAHLGTAAIEGQWSLAQLRVALR